MAKKRVRRAGGGKKILPPTNERLNRDVKAVEKKVRKLRPDEAQKLKGDEKGRGK